MFRVFPQSLKSKVPKNFEPLNQHQMDQILSVLTKYRNVCAHVERLFTYRTVDAIADTPLHKKLSLPQSGNQYEKGKQDLFAVVIAFKHLLSGKDFLEFKRKRIKEICGIDSFRPRQRRRPASSWIKHGNLFTP